MTATLQSWQTFLLFGTALTQLLGCAQHQPRPKVAFVDSPAFATVRERSFGVLNGDGEALVAQRLDHGFAVARFRRDASGSWQGVCQSPVVEGEDLEALRWVAMADGRLLLVVVTTATPDLFVQRAVLLDPGQACTLRFDDRVKLPVFPEIVSRGELAGGVTASDDRPGLQILDEPTVVRLQGSDDEVALFLRLRRRRVAGPAADPQIESEEIALVEERRLQVAWLPGALPVAEIGAAPPAAGGPAVEAADGEVASVTESASQIPPDPPTDGEGIPRDPDPLPLAAAPAAEIALAELTDNSQGGSFVIRPGEAGTLNIESDGELLALEIRRGCYGRPAANLELALGAAAYRSGEPPASGSFVRAVGRGHVDDEGHWRELWLLRAPARSLSLSVSPAPEERCLREVRALGFAAAQP